MAVTITPVSGARQRRRFVELARRFRGGSPHYVPPLTGEIAKLLDRNRNPALRHARQELWLAHNGAGEVLGRCGALYDERHAAHLGDRAAWFGFFDAADAATAAALLAHAWDWARRQGASSMLGPADPDTNHECGCLIEGHEQVPYLMMPHNPPQYGAWIEAAGLERARDLLAYETDAGRFPLQRLRPVVERIERRGGFALHAVTKRNLPVMLEVARNIYNEAWRDNWGFLPLTQEEFTFEASGLTALLDPALAKVYVRNGEPAGFILGLRDANLALHAIDGRLFPFGLLRFPFLLRKVRRMRVVALGVRPEFRNRGLETALVYTVSAAALAQGIDTCEMSWVLEDNLAMTRLAEAMGGRISRRYRLYRKR